ncbi:ankyrin repeat protein, partial [Bimuria novae-zelandiae CBS 107.79]
ELEAQSENGGTPLIWAVCKARNEVVKFLLGKGVDVDKRDDTQGWTSLHEACATGTSRVVTQLLDAGADIERPLPSGDTPLHVALTTENEEIALLLLERGANVSTRASKNRTSLHLAAYHSLPRVAEKLLRLVEPATIHAADEEIRTPLCYA